MRIIQNLVKEERERDLFKIRVRYELCRGGRKKKRDRERESETHLELEIEREKIHTHTHK